ncbi:lipoprotein LpqH, partial [Gordonia sp. GAMMA]
TIGIGSGGGSGIGVVLTSGDSPEVESVGLGSLDGVVLAYQKGAGGGSGEVTKDGDTYTVTGDASGIDPANPTEPVTKSYEIKVTCP